MNVDLDTGSPVPLYHQIAEAINYRIATGRLSAGEVLPPVREAARKLGVNMHTVRRAYGRLAEQGLVESRGARGTCVRENGQARRTCPGVTKMEKFLSRVLREAYERHGLASHELATLIANWTPRSLETREVVHVVECSELQCMDHIEEIESRWAIRGMPWPLSRESEPPSGPVVATYFHYNEIRVQWPHRLNEIRFVAILPDPGLPDALGGALKKGKRVHLDLCEFDEPKARNIAADLSLLFPADQYRIEPHVVRSAGDILSDSKRRTPVLFTPRVWAALTREEQANPRAYKVRYTIAQGELESLGRHFGWRKRMD